MSTGERILRGLSGYQGPSRPSPPQPRHGVRQASKQVPVHLSIEWDAPGQQEENRWVANLGLGESYRFTLRVTSQSRGEPNWHLWGEEMVVSLACPGCPELALIADLEVLDDSPLEPAAFRLSSRQIEEGAEVGFLVIVPEDCPQSSGELHICCARSEAEYPKPCLKEYIKVVSPYRRLSEFEAMNWNVDLASPASKHAAFLYVQENPTGWLTVRAWNQRHPFDEPLEIKWPEQLSLAALVEEADWCERAIGRVHNFSAQQIGKLQSWFQDLLDDYGQDLLLVIVDSANSEIPWEMIRLTEGYLGAEAEVVRWALFVENKPVKLLLEERDTSGFAIGYLDTGTAYSNEAEELDQLEAHRLGPPSKIEDLLSRDLTNACLLYVACHGKNPKQELSKYPELYYKGATNAQSTADSNLENFKPYTSRLPFVFVNACHSGRLLGKGEAIFGFPAVFLRKFADGYIGTLGAVKQEEASVIGSRILHAFQGTGGVRPSKLLRHLRREACEALDWSRPEKEALFRFLFTFMYVYYGNPLIRVSLGRSEPISEEHKR